VKLIKNIILAMIVLFILKTAWQKLADEHNYPSWPTAPIRLISAEVAISTTSTGRHYYVVSTTYDFTVDGKLYSSNLNKIGERHFSTDTEALAYLADLKARPVVNVHYDPSDPVRSTISDL
jgi:hypothetical protein